jgi:hypothetical protein
LLSHDLNSFRNRNHLCFLCLFAAKNRKAGFWTGLSRLAEAFSLNWLPSSPRQPHSPLKRILAKTAARSSATANYFILGAFTAVRSVGDTRTSSKTRRSSD